MSSGPSNDIAVVDNKGPSLELPVPLKALLEAYGVVNGKPNSLCGRARDLIERVAEITEVNEDGDDLVLGLSIEGEPATYWKQSPDTIKAYIQSLVLLNIVETGATGFEALTKIGVAARCIHSALERYYMGKRREESPLEIDKIQPTAKEQIVTFLARELKKRYVIKAFIQSTPHSQNRVGLYCYDSGYYRACEEDLKSAMHTIGWETDPRLAAKITRWVENEVLERLWADQDIRAEYNPDVMVLAFENVLFDWNRFLETRSIREAIRQFTPKVIAFHKIPHRLAYERLDSLPGLSRFSEDVAVEDIEEVARVLCPQSLEIFKQWAVENWILLFEIIGYTLYPRYDFNKAFMILGKGNNGKSQFANLLVKILGEHNVTSASFYQLNSSSDKYIVKELHHKLANISSELDQNGVVKNISKFKALTGEDWIVADWKYHQPIRFKNYAKLIFLSNQTPQVPNADAAFWRRWIVIRFPNTFPPEANFLARFTEEEIEGIILVSLLAFKRVLDRGAFSYTGDAMKEWLKENDPVYAFLDDLFEGRVPGVIEAEKDPLGRVDTDKLYKLFLSWVEISGKPALSKNVFSRKMREHGFPPKHSGKRKYYEGLKVVVEEEDWDGQGLTRYT